MAGGVSNYPGGYDDFDEDHSDEPLRKIQADLDRLYAAMNKVQRTLGIDPAGDFATVAERLNAEASPNPDPILKQAAFRFRLGDTVGLNAAFTEPTVGESFEDGDLSGMSAVVQSGGTVEVLRDAAITGGYGVRLKKPYAAAAVYARRSFTASNDIIATPASVKIRYRSIPVETASNGAGLRIFGAGVRVLDVHRDDGTGGLWLRNRKADGTSAFRSLGVVVPLNVPVTVSMGAKYNGVGTVSRVVVEIDGNPTLDASDFDLPAGTWDEIQIGSEHTSQHLDCDVDDLVVPPQPVGRTFYVSPTGLNSNTGLSEAQPWQTVAKVNGFALLPGDTVLFRRGATYSDAGLVVTASGTAARRIKIGAYGTGTDPIFDGGGNYANGNPLNPAPGPWPTRGSRDPIDLRGNWIVMEKFIAQQAFWAGIKVQGDDIVIRDYLSRWNVAGLQTLDSCARLEAHSYSMFFNAVMSVNAAGGVDDSGAFGHAIHGTDGNFHDFTSTGHRAFSYDFGSDGSTIEIYRGKRNVFHHFVAWDDEAMSELGDAASEDTTYHNFVFFSLNLTGLIGLNVQGSSWGVPLRTVAHHGTIYLPAGADNSGILVNDVTAWAAATAYAVGTRRRPSLTAAKANGHIYEVTVAGNSGAAEPAWPTNGGTVVDGTVTWIDRGLQASLRNMVVQASWKNGYSGAAVDEDYCLYFGHTQQQLRSLNKADPSTVGVGNNSKLGQNPLFVNTGTPDLHLQAGSPGVNAGQDLGYSTDVERNPRKVGVVDMGAYERQA